MSTPAFHLLAETAAAWGLPLDGRQLAAFEHYLALLQNWNQRVNLTAIVDEEGIVIRHFLDSLACAVVTGDLNGCRLIDVGSGAGFPGLPLKILFPDLELTLADSVAKKTSFLTAVVDELALARVTIYPERAEALGQSPEHREQYDWASARGVAALPVLAELLLPLCRVGGKMLALKGATAVETEVAAAMNAFDILGGGAPLVHPVQLPTLDRRHALVVVPKRRLTPESYPRRPGRPAKRPL